MERAGVAIKTLEERPDAALTPELQMMLQHFFALSRQRAVSFTGVPNAIPFTQIIAFYEIQSVDEYMSLAEFAEWMITLDFVYVDFYTQREVRKQQNKKPQPP